MYKISLIILAIVITSGCVKKNDQEVARKSPDSLVPAESNNIFSTNHKFKIKITAPLTALFDKRKTLSKQDALEA